MNFFNIAYAATGLFLIPFGNVSELVRNQKPWYGFSAQDPVLWVVRAQELQSVDCQKWINALTSDVPSSVIATDSIEKDLTEISKPASWWDSDDLEGISECDDFPCDVKLNEPEVKKMEAVPPEERRKKYLQLIKERISRYVQTQTRSEYEFPGDPVDPWALFDKKGYRTSLQRPTRMKLWARKLNFAPEKIKPIHQILDWRVSKSSSGNEASLWIRDVYTDHYFDSWGEWTHVSCGAKAKTVLVVQALVVEFDLLKKTDVFSKMMRGKMRGAVEEAGRPHLDQVFNRLKSRAH